MPPRLPFISRSRLFCALSLPLFVAVLGSAPLARAQFVYSNGTATITGGSDIVNSGSLISHYVQSGGDVTFYNPYGGYYLLNQISSMSYLMTGGTLYVPYTLQVGNQPFNTYSTASTTITQFGGTATITGGLYIRAWGASYDLTGGVLDSDITFGGSPSNPGYFHLGGGLLKASTITGNTGANYGVFYFDSGTLQAKALGSGEDWVIGDASLQVSSGGAKLDTAGYNRTIGAIVGHDFYSSAIDGGLTKLGEGTLTLTNSLFYTGATTVEAGTLLLNNSGMNLVSGTSALVVNGGTFVLGAHSETMGSLSGTGGTVNLNSYNLSLVKSTSGTYAGRIVGSGILVQAGTGTLVLSGSNSHGGTSITAGTVQFAKVSSLSGALAVASGATGGFNVGGAGEFSWSQISSLVDSSFQGGSKVALDTTNAAGGSYSISQDITDAALGVRSIGLVKLGGGTLALSGQNSYSGGTRISGGTLQFAKASALPAAGTLTVDSGATGAFNVGGTGEFTASGISAVTGGFQAGSFLALDTTNAGGSFTFSNTLAGGFGLTKTGAGTLVLSGSNSFTGGLRVNGGLVEFASTSALGAASGPLALNGGGLRWSTGNTADISSRINLGAGGGTFDTNGNTVVFSSTLAGTGALIKTGSGFLRLTAANAHGGDTTVNGGVLALAGGTSTHGQLGLVDGSNITINSGNINLEADYAVAGTNPYSNIVLTINAGGLLSTVNNVTILPKVVLNGGYIETASGGNFASGNYTFSNGVSTAGTGKLSYIMGGAVVMSSTVTVGTGDTLQIGAAIIGNNPLVKQGTGSLLLTGSSTFTGTVSVNAGAIEFGNASAFGNAANRVVLNSGSLRWSSGNTADLSSRITLGAGGGTIDTNGNNVTFASSLGGANGLTKVGAGLLTLSSTNTYTGGTIVTGGTLRLTTLAPSIGAIRGALTIGSGATVETAGVDALGYLDNAKINSIAINGGTLNNTAAGNNGWGVAYTLSNGALLTSNGGVSDAAAASMLSFGGPSTGNTSVNVTSGTNTIAGHVDLRGDNGNTNVNFTVATGATLNITAGISSHSPAGGTVGPVNLTKLGGGVLTLTGSNIFTGTTFVNGGLIEFNSNSALGDTANKVTLNGGGLRWATGNTADISSRFNAIGATGATFDTNGNNVTFASVLSGSGALTKNGLGTLSLNAANTYAGGTLINGGTLVAAQNNALGTGAVRVQGGALNVQNGVTFSNSVVLSSGTYSRTLTGSLAGKLNATSDFSGGRDTSASILAGNLSAQSTLVTSFATTSAASNDNLRLSDVYSFVGTGTNIFVLQLSSASVTDDGVLVWLDNGAWVNAIDGNTGNTATQAMQGFDGSYSQFLAAFSNPTLGQTLGAYGYDAATDSAWAVLNHNSDFALIPEPSTIGLLLTGGGLGLMAWRRRRAA